MVDRSGETRQLSEHSGRNTVGEEKGAKFICQARIRGGRGILGDQGSTFTRHELPQQKDQRMNRRAALHPKA